jgi:eukaryotic-like serine/threonine-protein kinase
VGTQPREVIGGRYEILGMVGAGGMGTVYRARDLELDEVVALKMLRREVASDPEQVERFRREVKLARRISHRNVARTFDIGEHAGDKFLTMEFVDGESLAVELVRGGRLDLARTLDLTEAVCAGLGAAHAAGVVHRDLKPENVLIGRDRRTVITDFGIARSLHLHDGHTLGGVPGTPAYMAPEQVEGAAVDGRADLYALGIMLYQMVTGRLPFIGSSPFMVASARLEQPPPDPRVVRPDLPAVLAETILRLLARRPDERFAAAAEVSAAVGGLTLPAMTPLPSMPKAAIGRPSMLPAPAAKPVAVLPLHNQGRADDQYLVDGLTEEIIDGLSMVRGLRVRSRSSVVGLGSGDRDPRELGRQLDVQVVAEGSVRRTPHGLRVSVRLISVADGFQIWARRFDRPEAELLAIADEITRAIAEALLVAAPALGARQAPGGDALDLYLRARQKYHYMRRGHIEEPLALFQQALELAPGHPTILAGYALARARQFFIGEPGSQDAVRLAREAAEQALALAPQMAEPRLALASVLLHEERVPEAVHSLRRALAINPSFAEAHEHLGRISVEAGLIEEGVRHLEAAIAIEPSMPARWELPRARALLGQFDRAREAADQWTRSTSDSSQFHFFARLRLAMWLRDRAWIEGLAGDLARLEGDVVQVAPLIHLVLRGGPLPSLPRIGPLAGEGGWRQRTFFRQIKTELHAFVGDVPAALVELAEADAAGLIDMAWLERCPLLEPLRGDPAYARVHASVQARVAPIIDALVRASG